MSGCVSVAWNDGTGSFGAGPCLSLVGAAPQHIVTADLDGDGWPDIAFFDAGLVRWFRQRPVGTFQAGPNVAATAAPPSALRAFDADDDGDLDLLADTATRTAIENRSRSARSAAMPRVGGSLQIEFLVDPGFAPPGTFVIPAGTFALDPGSPVPGVRGSLFVGAAPFVLPSVAVAVPAGTATWTTTVPALAALVGVDVAIQGLTFSPFQGLGCTNLVDECVLP